MYANYDRKFTGRNCPTGYVTASELAKLMRVDIKSAIAAGTLPGTARNYSVRVHNYSGGRSIYIEAQDLGGMWEDCKGGCNHWDCEHGRTTLVLTEAGQKVQETIEDIRSSYNYDSSDAQVDYFNVNFYGSASVESPSDKRFRESEKARKAARKAKVAA